MKIKQINYIYIERCAGENDRITFAREEIAGIDFLRVRQNICDKKKWFSKEKTNGKRENERLERVLKKWCNEETVIVANEMLLKDLELPNMPFAARRQELISNQKDIFRYFRERTCGQGKRSTFLLMLDSAAWKQKEIVAVLVEIKNYYEDIYVCVKRTDINIDGIAEVLYDECGVMIHIINDTEAQHTSMDAALFLVEYWNDSIKEYPFLIGYVVSEWENGLIRQRKSFRKNSKLPIQNKELYAGFVYGKNRRQVPYEIAIEIMRRQSLNYKQLLKGQEFEISIVAIYGIE